MWGPRAGPAAWPRTGSREVASLTRVESIVSFGLGEAGGRDHRALELEEILVIAHLREKNVQLSEAEEGPALSHVVLWCHGC